MTEPSEFRYWQRVDRPWVRALRRAARATVGFDPAPPDDVVRAFAAAYYDADPLAEAVVDELYLAGDAAAGRRRFEQALADGAGADAPASLRAMFADLDVDPPWLDRALLARGARAFRRFGVDVFRFAGAITLAAYAENSVAKPLALTGAYAGTSTRKRFLETCAFWIAVSEPGGLDRGAAGRAAALRVRMMHVFVRRRLTAHPEWDAAAWGVPISQADALLTILGGSFAPGLGLRLLGYRTSRADIEALLHFWRYVGHLMGVRPRWFPATLRDCWQLAFVVAMKGAGRAGDDGRTLCASYVEAFTPPPDLPLGDRARAWWTDGVHRGFARLFLPPPAYAANRLPSAGLWPLAVLAPAPLRFAAETARRAVPALDAIADRVARRQRAAWFAAQTGGRPPEYHPAERFTR